MNIFFLLANHIRRQTLLQNWALIVMVALLYVPIIPNALRAEPYMLRKQLTRSDGLPSNTIRHILRDRQGIFWIVTAKGICRYDGQRVYPFPLPSNSNPEQNIASLEQSLTYCVEDSSGAIWFGTQGGLIRFMPRTGSWKWYKKKEKENLMMNYVYMLYCDTRGYVWIGTQGGLLRYNVNKDSCQIALSQLPRENVHSILEDRNGVCWFGITDKPLVAYNPHTGKVVTGIPDNCQGGYYMHNIPGSQGVWLSPLAVANQAMQAPRLVMLDTVKNTFVVSPSALPVSVEALRGIDLYPYAEDERGAWYARVNDYAAGRCESGLYRIKPQTASRPEIVQAVDSSIFSEQIVRGNITAFCRDPRTGIVCVGVSEQGMTVLIPTGTERLSGRNRLGDVISLYTDKRGRLWCGTYKGLFMRTDQEGAFVPVRQPRQTANSLPIYDIRETSTGTILVASVEGLFRFDETSKTLHPFPALVATIGVTTIRNVRPDPFSKDFWVNAPSVGLLRCNENGNPLEYFGYGQRLPGAESETLGTSSIFAMQFDSEGNLWMGGMGVLLRWQRQSRKIECLTALPDKALTLQPTKLISIGKDSFIAAFFGIGIGHIGTRLSSFSETLVPQYIRIAAINSRLPDVQISGISKTDSSLWWTTRTNGIYQGKYVNNGDTLNGFSIVSPRLMLPSDENAIKSSAAEQAIAQTERGTNVGALTSDGKGGVVFDYYGDVLQANHTARVFTDTARVVPIGYFRNDSVMAGLPQHGDTLHCIYGGSFALSCAVVSLARPERHCLEYRLEGVDADWNIMPDASLRTVRYSSLQPGEYRLLVRTRTQDPHDEQPLLSANTLAFTVYVPYPWWMHPVTRTLGFLTMAVGFVWVGYTVQQRRVHQRLARLEREKEFENVQRLASEAQMQTLRLQMNPHFLYNVLAEIQMLVESGNEMASYYIAVFSRLLDRVLRKAVNNFISVSDEIHILKKYIELEELRNAGHLKCYVMLTPDAAHAEEMEFDDESDESDTDYWRSREMPTFILQPFVENAIRHGIRGLAEEDWKTRPAGGIITIHLFEEGDSLRCVVTDNGIGREEAARRKAARPAGAHLSIATSVTHERLELLEKAFGVHLSIHYNDLYDETGAAAGTEVTVVMPLRAAQA